MFPLYFAGPVVRQANRNPCQTWGGEKKKIPNVFDPAKNNFTSYSFVSASFL